MRAALNFPLDIVQQRTPLFLIWDLPFSAYFFHAGCRVVALQKAIVANATSNAFRSARRAPAAAQSARANAHRASVLCFYFFPFLFDCFFSPLIFLECFAAFRTPALS